MTQLALDIIAENKAKNVQQGLDGLEQESTVRQRTIKAVLAWLEEL